MAILSGDTSGLEVEQQYSNAHLVHILEKLAADMKLFKVQLAETTELAQKAKSAAKEAKAECSVNRLMVNERESCSLKFYPQDWSSLWVQIKLQDGFRFMTECK